LLANGDLARKLSDLFKPWHLDPSTVRVVPEDLPPKVLGRTNNWNTIHIANRILDSDSGVRDRLLTRTLAHELTHIQQIRLGGWSPNDPGPEPINFRAGEEAEVYPGYEAYTKQPPVPRNYAGHIDLGLLDPLDQRYTVEGIAERVGKIAGGLP